jgi:hypothetical protein
MSPVPMLLGCLLLLYLSEFLVWVRSDAWLFRRRGRGWEALTQGGLMSSSRGSLHWVYPVPQLDRAYSVRTSPLAGSTVSTALRPSIDTAFSVVEIGRRYQGVDEAFQTLRWTSWCLWGLVWVVCPLLLKFLGLQSTLWILISGALILMITNACLLARIHRKIFSEFGDERLRLVLSACLSPLAAIRSLDLAQKQALDGFHPLAVAAALPGFRGWEALAAVEWRRLRYSVASESSTSGAIPVDAPSPVEVRAAIEVLARRRGVDPALWDMAPKAEDPAHTQYCPRCRTQFTRQATFCRDCRWTSLLPIPQ